MATKLNVVKKADGVFWMTVDDFIDNFKYLYICRTLSKNQGWNKIIEKGAWKGKTAAGLPSRANPNVKLANNPQYQIVVSRPCQGFISLEQMDKVSNAKGKHFAFIAVSTLKGKKVTKSKQLFDKEVTFVREGPINLSTTTAECDFSADLSYPYKFTVFVANKDGGEAGEGDFKLGVYAKDPNLKVKAL